MSCRNSYEEGIFDFRSTAFDSPACFRAHKNHYTSSCIFIPGNPEIPDSPECLPVSICKTDGRQRVSQCWVIHWYLCSLGIEKCIDIT